MKYQMIVFDLDGTVVTSELKILQGTLFAIQNLRERGFRVSIATGRSYKSALPYLETLEIQEPVVLSNGAVFQNPKTNRLEVIYSIPLETALIILFLAKKLSCSLKVFLEDGTIYKSNSLPWPHETSEFEIGNICDNIPSVLEEDPIKIVFYEHQNSNIEMLKTQFEKIVGVDHPIRFFRSAKDTIEILNKQASKGLALKKMLSMLKIKMNNIIAVGDQENDYEMIRDSGIGVVAGKGNMNLLEVAQLQIPSPEQQGVEYLSNWIQKQIK